MSTNRLTTMMILAGALVACADPNPSTLNQKCFYDEDCDEGQYCELIPNRNDGLCRVGEGEDEASSGDSGAADSLTAGEGSTSGSMSTSDGDPTSDGPTSLTEPTTTDETSTDSSDAESSGDETGEPAECPARPPADEVSYAPVTTLPIDPNPQGVALADLDSDGDLDLVVTSYDNGTLTVFQNDGGGTFSVGPVTNLGPSYPTKVALGAIADGTVDAVVVAGVAKNVMRLRGNGDGSFAGNSSYGETNECVELADVNGDGILDLLGGNNMGLTVALGSAANETFGSVQTFDIAAGGPVSVATGDIDGDGDLDVVTVHYLAAVIVPMLGTGNGSFQAQPSLTTGGLGRDVKLADLDGDGNLDVVYITAGQNSDAARVRWGNGDGSFSATMDVLSVATTPWSLAVGDVDHDGDADIVVASQSGVVTVILSKGDRTFEPSESFACSGNLRDVAIGDLNDDCVLDIVAVSSGPSPQACVLLSN
jgi:hypothetical protein